MILNYLARSRAFRSLMKFLFRWKGPRAVAHAMRRRLVLERVVEIADFDGDLKFTCHLDEHIGSFMYWRGAFSTDQLQVLKRILLDGMTFIDVGANQGEFSLFAAKRLPAGRVIAFEPDPEMFRRLQGNIAANGFENVTAAEMGLWCDEAVLPLHKPTDMYVDGTCNAGLGSLFGSEAEGRSEACAVSLTTLDAFVARSGLTRVDVIKLDVEGAELPALRGGRSSLERHRPWLIVEVDLGCMEAAGTDHDDLFDFLAPWYRFETIMRGGRTVPLDRGRIQRHQDVLCVPR